MVNFPRYLLFLGCPNAVIGTPESFILPQFQYLRCVDFCTSDSFSLNIRGVISLANHLCFDESEECFGFVITDRYCKKVGAETIYFVTTH